MKAFMEAKVYMTLFSAPFPEASVPLSFHSLEMERFQKAALLQPFPWRNGANFQDSLLTFMSSLTYSVCKCDLYGLY